MEAGFQSLLMIGAYSILTAASYRNGMWFKLSLLKIVALTSSLSACVQASEEGFLPPILIF